MRRIITTTYITLDGVMQSPGSPEEDASNGFKYGGWLFGGNEEDDNGDGEKIIDTKIQGEPFDLLLGRRTYDIFASFWPDHKEETHWGKPFDRAKKYVVSSKPIKLSWEKSKLITGDVVEEIKKLKHSDGPDLLVHGSGSLIQTLLKNNLIDRMHIWNFPITIGSGKRLFGEGTQPERFKQVDAKILSTGVLFATYEPSSSLNTG